MTMTGTLYVKFYICIPMQFLFSLYVPLYVPRFIYFLNYLDCGGNFVGLDTYILWIFFFFLVIYARNSITVKSSIILGDLCEKSYLLFYCISIICNSIISKIL